MHLGVFDDCAKMARVELGEEKLIGETVHSYQEASAVKSRGVCDYVGLGPFRKSSTKRELIPSLSRDDYIRIIQFLEPIPCYLIGGIELGDFFPTYYSGIAWYLRLFKSLRLEEFWSEFI